MRKFKFIAVVLCSCILITTGRSEADSANDASSIFSNVLAPYLGSGASVQNNLITPMMNSGKLTTPDSKTTFNVNSFQATGTPVLVISVGLSTATGDISKIIVQQDPAGSGNLSSATIYPLPGDGDGQVITSICQEGYVQCDPGNGANCRYRQWSVDPNGILGAMAAVTIGGLPGVQSNQIPDGNGSIAALSSCYCFDYHCSKNNNAVLNIDDIAGYTGGSIVSAYLSGSKGMAISSASTTGTGVISYYGFRTQNANASSSSLSTAQLAAMPAMSSSDTDSVRQSYYTDAGSLSTKGSAAMTQQAAISNSMYNLVSNTSLKTSGATVTCSNSDIVTANTVTRTDSKTGSKSFCVDDQLDLVLTQSSPTSWAFGERDLGTGGGCSGAIGNNCGAMSFDPNLNTQARLLDTYNFVRPDMTYNYKVTHVDVISNQSGAGCSSGGATTISWLPSIPQNTPMITCTLMSCGAGGAQSPTATWQFNVQYLSQEISETKVNGCSQYDSNPDCTLQSVTNDGCPLVVQGMPAGTCGQTQIVVEGSGGLPDLTVYRPYKVQTKMFYCKNNNPYDFTSTKQRINQIAGSTTISSSNMMGYSDQGTQYSFAIPAQGSAQACPQICKTKIPKAQSDLISDGNSKSNLQTTIATSDDEWTFFYRDCKNDGSGNFTCPVNAAKGEVVVNQCGCGADMGDAIASLGAVDEAKDAVCSKVTQ